MSDQTVQFWVCAKRQAEMCQWLHRFVCPDTIDMGLRSTDTATQQLFAFLSISPSRSLTHVSLTSRENRREKRSHEEACLDYLLLPRLSCKPMRAARSSSLRLHSRGLCSCCPPPPPPLAGWWERLGSFGMKPIIGSDDANDEYPCHGSSSSCVVITEKKRII